MSVVITTYTLASGLMQQGMTWWQAMLTILLGNVIVLVPMILNAHAGTKYGVSFPVLCRASFGVRGANVPGDPAGAGRVRLVRHPDVDRRPGAGHAAGRSVAGMARVPAAVWISFAVFWLVQVWIIVNGLEGIKKLESWSAPLLLAGGALLLVWAVAARRRPRAHPQPSRRGCRPTHAPFWQLFPAALTANVGYWATLSLNIPDFTRYARSQRSRRSARRSACPPR